MRGLEKCNIVDKKGQDVICKTEFVNVKKYFSRKIEDLDLHNSVNVLFNTRATLKCDTEMLFLHDCA